jgi:DNA invertase Pin-like site-specific DNA recombinase
MKVAAYARVSTSNHHQDPEVQLRDIRQHCQLKGWELTEVYVDKGISGTKASRPELNRLMADAELKKFDAVIVWKFDRFARSTSHLLKSLEHFRALNIEFVSLTEGVDTSTAVGKLVFTILAGVAELERSVTVERIKAGLRNAKAKGHLPGPKRYDVDMEAVKQRMAAGESQRKIAISMDISPALLIKRLKKGNV